MRKISRRSFLKAATVACALTALTACGGGDESAAVSVAKDENGAYVDTLTITLGRFAEPSAAALFPEGQTFEDNAHTRYIESKLNVDLVDSFEAGGDAYTNQLATCVASGELPDGYAADDGAGVHYVDGVPANFIAEKPGPVVYRVLPNDVPGPAVIREAQEMALLAP